MASCEKCGRPGFLPEAMYIDKNAHAFVGPCCATQPDPNFVQVAYQGPRVVSINLNSDELEYGIKASNKGGIQAYVNYGGLQISFDRSAEDIRRWAVSQGFVTQKKVG